MVTNNGLLHSKCYYKYDFELGGERKMRIEITVEELKELLKKDTPVESTTDAINIDSNKIATVLDGFRSFETAN